MIDLSGNVAQDSVIVRVVPESSDDAEPSGTTTTTTTTKTTSTVIISEPTTYDVLEKVPRNGILTIILSWTSAISAIFIISKALRQDE